MQTAQNPRIRRTSHYCVPIYTGYVAPATMGIENLGEIECVEERGGVTAWAISSVTPGTGIATVVSAATTLAAGNQAVVSGVGGISDDVNDDWTVTPNSSTSTQLNGCTATGAYSGGGVLSHSTEEFNEVPPCPRNNWVNSAGPTTSFQQYAWETDILRFPPCSVVRQIRVTYTLSGNAPTTTTASTGIDDCQNFLSYRIAGRAGPAKGMLIRAKEYNAMAVGPEWDSKGIPGGLLGQLLDAGIRNLQRLPPSMRRSPAFGRSRARRWRAW